MTVTEENNLLIPHLRRIGRVALIVGLAGFLAAIVMIFINPRQALPSYLMSFLLWFGVSMGSMALLMLYDNVGGRWGDVIRPTLETAARGVLLMAVLFIPIAVGWKSLFPWAREDVRAASAAANHQYQAWLHPGFFFPRAIFYWAIWSVLAILMNLRPRPDPALLASIPTVGHGDRGIDRPTRDHNPGGAESPSGSGSWLKNVSAPGVVIYGVTVSLAAIDWVMSLQPGWYSTIYGLLFIVSQALGALAFATVVAMALSGWLGQSREAEMQLLSTESINEPGHGRVMHPNDYNDLGNLMLTFTILWAYMSFSQFLIQWAGNLPDETAYYRVRYVNGWGVVGLALIALHFFVPFFFLLSRDVKRNGRRLGMLAAFIVVMRQVDYCWFVSPSVHRGQTMGASLGIADFAAPIGMAGLFIAFFCWQLAGRAGRGVSLLPPPGIDPHAGHARSDAHAAPAAPSSSAVALGATGGTDHG